LRTDLFTGKAFSFIQMFRNPSLDKTSQEAEFIKAADIVLKASSVNKRVQLQIIDYLVRGFEQIGMDGLLTHIANNYIEESACTDGTVGTNLNKKLEGFTKMALGKTVPDIRIDCSDKGVYNLYKSTAPYTLILFWASWCPHCLATLPEIKKVYDEIKDKSLDVVAISIDTSVTEWRKAISAGCYTWKNCCDLKGWNGSAAASYYVSATPSVFLLDQQKKIIAKPLTADELLSKLRELGIQ
jgi:thiol-disulfide isomerase/thioredoxin